MEKTENEIIAEFMDGWNKDPNTRKIGINIPHMNDQWWDIDELQYHKSWDWLMPVVEKIRDIEKGEYGLDSEGSLKWDNVVFANVSSSIDGVHKAVVDFIHWYNSHKL